MGPHDERLNLLTRRQHGSVLADALIAQNLWGLGLTKKQGRILRNEEHARALSIQLSGSLYRLLTSIGDIPPPDRLRVLADNLRPYGALLQLLGLKGFEVEHRLDRFGTTLLDVMKQTQYLCWLEAEPGEVLNLRVSYTVEDQKYKGSRGSVAREALDFARSMRDLPDGPKTMIAEWSQELGLTPMAYKFKTPSSRHAASYYFTLKPPRHSDAVYLGWGSEDFFTEEREVDCSFSSAHVHFEDDHDLKRGRSMRAYIRSSPHHHKQILGVTILNLILVYLLATGRVTKQVGISAQSILLLTPTVFLAYLAQGQRHYYARAHRAQRAVLWGYLACSLAFVVTVSFSQYEGNGSRGLGLVASAVAWMLAVSSAALLAWYLFQGPRWEAVTRGRQKRELMKRPGTPPWQTYNSVIHRYAGGIVALVLFAITVTLALIVFTWHRPPSEPPPPLPWEAQPRLVHNH